MRKLDLLFILLCAFFVCSCGTEGPDGHCNKYDDAVKYDKLTHQEVLDNPEIKVMDIPAIEECMQNNIDITVIFFRFSNARRSAILALSICISISSTIKQLMHVMKNTNPNIA